MYDVAIVGAGPAGSTLARLIGDKYRVLLLDKRPLVTSTQSTTFAKCCGGLLAPDAQKMLSKLGLGLPKSVLLGPQLFVVRAIDIQQRLEKYYQRYYINVDRGRFDDWLRSMVPESVDIKLGWRFKSYEKENDHFKMEFIHNNRLCFEKARILVGADGASSTIRKQALPRRAFPRSYFAIQEWVEADSQMPYFSTLFDREITDHYCWTIPKGNYLVIGAALRPKEAAYDKFTLFKKKLKDWGFRFGKTTRREGAFILQPMRIKQLSTGTKGIALLGEAAGWISPSSAEGISYAFRSALILAHVLRKALDNFEDHYYRKTKKLRRNIFLKGLKSHFIFNPYLRKMVMRSGLNSMDISRL